MTPRRRLLLTILPGAAIGVRPAVAHGFLERASPPVGGTVGGAPQEIRLWFSEPLEPRFSRAEVTTASGARIEPTSMTLDAADRRQLVVGVPPLKPGGYRVRWRVVSVDGHRTEGSYTFQVRP